jgi:hypothetical protein
VNKKTCLESISSLKFKNKLKKYFSEGYPQKQALAMTYAYFRKNPDSKKPINIDKDIHKGVVVNKHDYWGVEEEGLEKPKLWFSMQDSDQELGSELRGQRVYFLINENDEAINLAVVITKNPIKKYARNNSPVGKSIFETPDEMSEFLNKHLKDRWRWEKNEIIVHTGQGNWPIARTVEKFFATAGFSGSGSEMDELGNIYVRAYIPKQILKLKEKE